MSKRSFFAVISFVISFACVPTGARAATSVVPPVLFVEHQKSVSVNAGQYFMIALASNRTTGFSWSYARFARTGVAQMVGSAYSASSSPMVGAGGKEILLFKALAAGATELTLGYRRPWEKKQPARTATFDIMVSGANRTTSALPCVRTQVAGIRRPVGPAEYQSGHMLLTNGVSLRVSGTPPPTSIGDFHPGDSVIACYGNERNWADAPRSRSTTVLDVQSGGFFGSLIGEWPKSSLVNP